MDTKKPFDILRDQLAAAVRPKRRSDTVRQVLYFLAAVACLANMAMAAAEKSLYNTVCWAAAAVFLVVWLILDLVDQRLLTMNEELRYLLTQTTLVTRDALEARTSPRSPAKEPAEPSQPN